MVADTTTPSLQLLLQGTGNNNNAWGQNLNDQVISRLDRAVAGVTRIDGLTGGTITLNDTQALSSTILLLGALTSKLTVIVPTRPKQWKFQNFTSGFFPVLVKTATGLPSNLPQGCMTDITCIDNDGVYRSDMSRVGEYFYYAGSSPPSGAFECNNALLNRADWPDLFSRIGTLHGSTDTTNFRLPPGYDTGRYLRSRSASINAGMLLANQNKTHTHTGSGTTGLQNQNHAHTGSGITSGENTYHTHSVSGQTSGISTGHWHTATGLTNTESSTHTHVYNEPQGTTSTPGGSYNAGGPPQTNATSGQNVLHQHSFSLATNGQSNDHSHSWSGVSSPPSVDHYHGYSFTTSVANADHIHSYSFTTSTGTSDGAEARPESIVGILCVRY